MMTSHFLEHSTYFAPALKKQTKDALKIVDEAEKNSKKIIEGASSQLLPKEEKHLHEQVEKLTLNDRQILLDKLPGQEYIVQVFSNTDSQEIAWRFFKNMGRQAGENAWIKAKQNYQDKLQLLTNIFSDLLEVLQAQKMDILSVFPDYNENIAFIFDQSVHIELQVNAIYQKLQILEAYINGSVSANNYNFEDIQDKISNFKDHYLNFKNCKKVYNEASVNMTYLQQSTVGATL